MPSNRIIALLATALLTTMALAVHQKNAGPENIELKFKLPPPAPLSPAEEMKTFAIEKGFSIQLVASEPVIQAPVAMSFDDQGRLYVVEMRGYMRDLEGTTEKQPMGRVTLLEDTDGDGYMEKARVFLDDLVLPRAVMAVNGGALVAVPPNLLFCKDTDGDGKADVREVVANDYGTMGGQPEHMANSPTWTLDNSVWSAGYSSRFKLRNGVWQRDIGLGRGQWGLCQDDVGRLYFNYNSDMLRCDLLPTEAFAKNPLLRNATSINAKLAADQTLHPTHPTPGVNRGYDAKSLRSDGTLIKPTATCGAMIYRGDLFPASHRGNAFVPEPSANLIKRFSISETSGMLKAKPTSETQEFLASTDERFRPVQAINGPDGAIYVADMYRGIIQHQGFLTHYLIANIKDRKLDEHVDAGRIWRLVPTSNEKPVMPRIGATSEERIAALSHPNGAVRDAAQRLLVEAADAKIAPALRALLKHESPLTRLHALWTLDGLGTLGWDDVKPLLSDAATHVRATAVRLTPMANVMELASLASTETDTLVLAHLTIRLAGTNLTPADAAAAALVAQHGQHAMLREAALTGLRGKESAFAKTLTSLITPANSPGAAKMLEDLASMIAQANKAQPVTELLPLIADHPGAIAQSLITGLSRTDGKSKTPAKLIWLDSAPLELARISNALKSSRTKDAFARFEQRLAWPGKPGVPAPPVIVPLTAAQQAAADKGKLIYAGLCAACHQPHGYGLDGLAPPLVDSEWVLGKPQTTARIVLHGLAGNVKVSGRSWNLAMPPLPQLTDDDIASVLTYIRREWDHGASPVDAAFVAKLRASDQRSAMWTADELKTAEKAKK